MKGFTVLRNFFCNPVMRFRYLNHLGVFAKMSDLDFVKKDYKIYFNKDLNLEIPVYFNEKLNWLKLYDHKDIYSVMVDKHLVKSFLAEKIGKKYVVPELGVYDSFDEITIDALPSEFVLKTTHDSGTVYICHDKSCFLRDRKKIKRKFTHALRNNFYRFSREWVYKNVKPRIITEKLLVDDGEYWLTDYKFFCFNGIPKIMYIGKDKAENVTNDFFDMDFNHLDIVMEVPNSTNSFEKPVQFEKMQHLAKMLSEGIPFLRVDFYIIQNRIYVGELTFYHNACHSPVRPEEWDLRLGSWIHLPRKELPT